ncbi:MFS transporter [Achromobacter pulmonis]|uniref:MFS transporter n=1 Tax=Achromobacter pulmonis TaxID=1389932 RepID=A0A2N8KKE7_9BURK|nr:MFS transporter [Achromobacter pulmonis]PND33930.1 MFS transporter [Achromobacter pulmonis]
MNSSSASIGARPARVPARKGKLRDIVAANIGAFFEWYDLLVYALFALPISRLFFPSDDPQTALLFSFLTFASSYLIRPVGAVLLGIYADKKGRKAALSLTATLMLIGTALMALIPTYATIGALAPVALVAGRLLQGFSAGGEFGTANSYLTEQNPRIKAFLASLQFSTTGLALVVSALFAYFINHYLTEAQIDSWGWRLPFVFGCLIGPVALYIRFKIDETPEFDGEQAQRAAPLRETFRLHKRYLLLGALIVAAGNVASYLNIYMPTFAINNLGISKDDAFVASICSGLVCTFLPMLGGLAADRYGAVKTMAAALVLGLIIIVPTFRMLTGAPSFGSLVLFQCLMSLVFYSFYFAPVGSLLAQLFPTSCRTTGVSIAYVASQTFFGGVTPVVVGFLVTRTGTIMSPAYYLIAIGLVAIVALVSVRAKVR